MDQTKIFLTPFGNLTMFSAFLAAGGSSSGRTTDSDSVNPGSNPGPSATQTRGVAIAAPFLYRSSFKIGLVQQPDKIVVRCALTIYPYSLGPVVCYVAAECLFA